MTANAYGAIHEETKEFFAGAKSQVAFSSIGALKNSMNQANKYGYNNDKYNYKDPIWSFYSIDSINKTFKRINK